MNTIASLLLPVVQTGRLSRETSSMTGSDERQLHSQATSILRAFKNDRTVTLFVQGVEMALSNRGGLLIAIVLELTESSTSACHLFAARRSVLGVRAPFESSRHLKRNEKVF